MSSPVSATRICLFGGRPKNVDVPKPLSQRAMNPLLSPQEGAFSGVSGAALLDFLKIGLCFADHQVSALEQEPVQAFCLLFHFFACGHLDKTKTARLASVEVVDNPHGFHTAALTAKQILQFLFGGTIGQVPDIDSVRHSSPYSSARDSTLLPECNEEILLGCSTGIFSLSLFLRSEAGVAV